MRILIQRVQRASVTIEDRLYSSIGQGMIILCGVSVDDTEDDVEWLVNKVSKLRIFDDSEGVMNLDIQQVDGEILVVSQFTLQAATRKGNRPSYIKAAKEEKAVPLYEMFKRRLSQIIGKGVGSGVFGADMQVELVNDGPVTIWIDSLNRE